MAKHRPVEAVFADGRKAKRLALRPESVNVSYPTIDPEDIGCFAEVVGGIGVMCIDGPLEHRMTWWTNYESIAIAFKALCDDSSVNAIMLKFDSPGGECSGLNETVAIMQGMKADSGKPVIGYVDESCYSAAYALAMVCDELYLPESGGVGSIGVITAMVDVTALNDKEGVRVEVIASGTKKTDGHPCVALTDGAIKRTQSAVDKLAQAFFGIVAEGRGISAETVESFEAGTFMGSDAVDAGLADGVMSFDQCLTFAQNLFSLPNQPTDQSAGKDTALMAGKIAAAKAAEDAKKAAAAKAGPSASAPAAKVTKTKTVTTDTHEEEVDDGQAEEAEMPEGEPDGDEPEDENDDDKDASASVVAFARQLTGKVKASSVVAALRGMAAQKTHADSLQARLDRLEADAKSAKLNALISSGTKAGKLAPAQRAWALTQSPESLKAFLDAAPAMVRTVEDPAQQGVDPVTALSPREIAMCAEKKIDVAAYAKKKAEMNARNGKA
jgi:signal peptide peptidase SppA